MAIIEARVKQKTATLAEWMANDIVLLDGEQAFVITDDGAPMNFKIGDGTKPFRDLPDWIAYDQSSFVPVSGNVLPPSDGNVHYSIVGAGTYTQSGGADVVVADGNFGIIADDGTSWSLVDMGELPTTPIASIVMEGGEEATSQDAVYQYTKPLYDLTTASPNLSDNVFELGGWNENGNPQNSSSVLRLPDIVITPEMVGQHWINGRGILPQSYSFVSVKNVTVTEPLLSIMGAGSADNLAPITFTITPEMVTHRLRIGIGMIASEPEEGYENTFTWNMGEQPMPFFIPKGKLLINGKDVNGVALEYSDEGKVVRVNKVSKKTYTTIEGVKGLYGSGFYRYDNGNLQASTTRKIITFPVNDSLKYALSGTVNGSTLVADAVYFDDEMNYLGFGERFQEGTIILNRKELELPSGTAYIGTGNFNDEDFLTLESFVEGDLDYDEPVLESNLTIEDNVITKIKGYDIYSSPVFTPFKRILAFGDSTTYGADLPDPTADRWTTLLQNKLGLPIINYGFSGARAEEVVTWYGGIVIECQLANNTIPASGSRVGVSFIDVNPFRATTVPNFDVYIILQDGTLTKGNLNRSTGFMQEGNTPINTVNGKVRITGASLKDYTNIDNLVIGSFGANNATLFTNGTLTSDEVIETIIESYSNFAGKYTNCLLWSQNVRNVDELPIILPVEDYLEKQFGTRFCNMRKYLASMKALDDAQVIDDTFTPTQNDLDAIELGLIPPSFKYVAGSAHVNELGHKLQANYLYAHIQLYFL